VSPRACGDYAPLLTRWALPVNREIRQGRGFIICDLRFDICHCPEITQCQLGIESGYPQALATMTNIKSQISNLNSQMEFFIHFAIYWRYALTTTEMILL
jgi:hypothetical protein